MADWDRTGEQFGEYRLKRKLGQGGFAEVYLGEHVHLQTNAAIKLLLARVSAEEQQQFLEEARKVAQLEHPHIVRVLAENNAKVSIPKIPDLAQSW
jgi:serine/threonine-protein kinase